MGAAHHRGASKQDYQTPEEFIWAVQSRFDRLQVDLAADADNHQAPKWIGEDQDSLIQPWHEYSGLLWLNPPYDNIGKWAKKCHDEVKLGAHILFLVPASVGSNWYRDYVHRKATVYFLNKRLKFVGAKDPYPKDLLLAEYAPAAHSTTIVWDWKRNVLY